MASPQSPTMTSLLFSLFFFLLAAFSFAVDMSILDGEHGLSKRTEAEVMAMFEAWTMRNGKEYNAFGERERRFEIFKDNLKYIDERNAMNLTYKLGLTSFADLTNEEYRFVYLGRVEESQESFNGTRDSNRYAFQAGEDLPESMDWRKKGAVLPTVKHQGQCDSCWAFSAVAAVEGINQIVTGKLISLSEQELLDCSRNHGCGQKGSLDLAFLYIISNGGVDTEEHYPYKSVQTQCNPKRAKVVSIYRSERVSPSKDEKSLQKAVANQPISVSIEANGKDFQMYESGVFTGSCGINPDHFVVAVGYGSESGLDYWILRNSYGPNWGENGYMRMHRNVANREGKCGIAKWCIYPIKKGQKNPNLKEVWSS